MFMKLKKSNLVKENVNGASQSVSSNNFMDDEFIDSGIVLQDFDYLNKIKIEKAIIEKNKYIIDDTKNILKEYKNLIARKDVNDLYF